jgi:hypothetical protein
MTDPFVFGYKRATISKTLYNIILRELENGRVPPIYHSLVMAQPCVAFRRNADTMPRNTRLYAATISQETDKLLSKINPYFLPPEVTAMYIGNEGGHLKMAVIGNLVCMFISDWHSIWKNSNKYAIATT